MLARLRSEGLRTIWTNRSRSWRPRTPREAALDHLLRPRLVQWCKSQIGDLDKQNLRTGRDDTMDWLADELDLDELPSRDRRRGSRPPPMATTT